MFHPPKESAVALPYMVLVSNWFYLSRYCQMDNKNVRSFSAIKIGIFEPARKLAGWVGGWLDGQDSLSNILNTFLIYSYSYVKKTQLSCCVFKILDKLQRSRRKLQKYTGVEGWGQLLNFHKYKLRDPSRWLFSGYHFF